MRWIYPAGLSAMLLLGGCGGSDTADNTTLNTRTGIFVDSPVDGLIFEGNLGTKGVTNSGGLFKYQEK